MKFYHLHHFHSMKGKNLSICSIFGFYPIYKVSLILHQTFYKRLVESIKYIENRNHKFKGARLHKILGGMLK